MHSNKKFIERFNLMITKYGSKQKFINTKPKEKDEHLNEKKKL